MRPGTTVHLLALLVCLLLGCPLHAQQLTYTQDLNFQTITSTPALAGTFALYPYGPAHFVAHASKLLNPADFIVYDSLGQATGLSFSFHPDLPLAAPSHFVADAAGNAYIAGYYTDTTQLPLSHCRIVVAKYLPSGAPDTAWGLHGIWYGDTAFADGPAVRGLHVLASGALRLVDVPLVAGSNSPYFFLRRITPTGQLDTLFGTQGSILLNPDNRPAQAFYFAADGSTYACVNVGTPANAWMARWFANGNRDTTFNIPGSVRGILNILPDGRIISDGYTVGGSWGLRRHWSNGMVDASYAAPSVNITGYDCALPGGGWMFMYEDYNGTPFATLTEFSAIRPDGTLDPAYMPAGQPLVFNMPASFWPPPGCYSGAVPGFRDLLALGAHRLIYSDYMVAQVPGTGGQQEYVYYVCPRIVSLVTDLQTVGGPAPAEASNLALWPNPVADHYSLRIPTRASSAQVQLYDLAGKALPITSANATAIKGGLQYDFEDLAHLPAGLYLLRVDAGGQRFVAKLFKE